MFRLVALAALGAGLLVPLEAQVTATAPETETPQYGQRWDLSAGYQYSHFNPSNNVALEAVNLTGWTGSATLWFRPLWGMEASARGLNGVEVVPPNAYGIPKNPPMTEKLALFGPSFRIVRHPRYTLGMHFLVGAAYGVFDSGYPAGIQPEAVGIYNDKLALGMGWGGYADYNVTSRWSVRFVADWQPTHYGFSWQNESADSVGLVFKLGSLPSK